MELPKMGNRSGGGMFDGIKSKLGIGNDQGYNDDYEDYDDYGEYAYDGDDADEGGYSPYAEVTTRTAGTNRPRRSSYTDRAASNLGERRGSTAHPPLVSMNDVRANTPSTESRYDASSSHRRTSSLGRNSMGRASDFAPSGAELETFDDTPEEAPVSDAGTTADLGTSRTGGYNSLFDSSPTRAASQPAPASAVGIKSHEAGAAAKPAAKTGAYDPYAAYEGAGSATHKPTRTVVVLTPHEYGEVESIARSLKAGDAVVLSLRNTPSQLSKRILDFAFGVASALDASVDCIADKVFAITRTSALSDAECLKLRGQGVI